jgi:hypothetical protein
MEQAQNGSISNTGGAQTHASFQETAVLRALGEALQLISAPEKQAFLQACRQCPDIVQREANPMLFLIREEFNPWKAAVRMVKYWETRTEVFGPDRAFLSVADLSGKGALVSSAVDFIATGVGVVLPPDELGRLVLFIDRSRVPLNQQHDTEIEVRRQVGFYVLTKIMNLNPNFVVIMFFTTRPRFVPGMGSWFSDVVLNAFPVKMHAVRVVCRSPRSAYQRFVATFVPVIVRLSSRIFTNFNTTVDIGDQNELKKKLVQYGLFLERVPEAVGGSWSYDVFDEWVKNERKSKNRPSLSRMSSDSAQDSAGPFGLELLAAAVEQQHEGKASSSTEQGENEMKVDKGTGLSNKITPAPTCLEVKKDHPSDATPLPSQDSDPYLQSLSQDETEAVQRALDCIPSHEKTDYCEAMQYVPDLVKAEAGLAAFLSPENGNAQAAATRVVCYWNIRKRLFRERAFLPLQQTGGTKNQ